MVNHFSINKLMQAYELPGSFNKEYTTKRQEVIDSVASTKQSSVEKDAQSQKEINNHNLDMLKEYIDGEEGIDYKQLKEGELDPERLNPKKLAKEIRAEIKAYAVREPELAAELEKYVFEENEVDEALNSNEVTDADIKYYPGSDKGPLPEDDPEFYSNWFVKNQPKAWRESDLREIGVSKRFVTA